jgi:hypothetical protein
MAQGFGKIVLGCAALASVTFPAPGRAQGLAEGSPFPEIRLPSLENAAPMSIRDFRGKKVVLHIFASW